MSDEEFRKLMADNLRAACEHRARVNREESKDILRGLSLWAPGDDQRENFFGLDRTRGINRTFEPRSLWQKLRDVLRGAKRGWDDDLG